MGLDIGVATGRIEYLDRVLFCDNEDLHAFIWDVLSDRTQVLSVYSGKGNAFFFLEEGEMRKAAQDYVDVLRGEGADDQRIDRFEKALGRFLKAALRKSPDKDYALVHANW